MSNKEIKDRIKRILRAHGERKLNTGPYTLVELQGRASCPDYFIVITSEKKVIYDSQDSGWLDCTTSEERAAACDALKRAMILDDLADV